ncbi:MAG: DUF4236 domain-containing protein, partial [Candidatus Nanopelagicaceae bacterium]|nr:DUF4236 domain-containing protein [Candidatus Nanopelagicaceae bacterium]
MGLRFRRTLKIAPGLRLNFNKNSVGLSIGPRGAKYTINSSGRHTASVGVPGSGLSYSESSGGGKRRAVDSNVGINNRGEDIHLDSPGIFAGKAETLFYQFATDYLSRDANKTFDELKSQADFIRSECPEIAPLIDLVMIAKVGAHSATEALTICERLYNIPDLLDHKIAEKYFDEFRVSIPIARGISFLTDYNNSFLTYTYSEILQALGQPEKALEIIEEAPDSQEKEIALLDLALATKDYETVIDQTNEIENIDDATAILLVFRAIAFRELKQYELAIEAFKLALAKRSRESEILNFAKFERALTYE